MFNEFVRACSAFGLCLVMGWAAPAMAGVTAEHTRVIFPAGNREVTLRLANLNTYPVLVQTWIDDGALDSTPDKAVSAMMTLPPVFRLAPTEHRTLRLLFTGGTLPADRETLFWLNIHEIPPSDASKGLPPDQQRLVVTMHTQMKVLYRPGHLPFAEEEAAAKLIFTVVQGANGQMLRVENPTPYYMTLGELQIDAGGKRLAVKGDMLAPYDHLDLPLLAGNVSLPGSGARLRFSWIDDDGNPQDAEASLH
ncbi:molecular chaperone [Pseudomonas nitroreducens]|uniref:fimbrial biogenesis chaperone n=1 Tax=Pseudomonas nitroreducens TaxID=46680 RepID=UPI002D7FE077|nr:molecular chaperone [Pseudomonas nitroreducens]